MTRDDLLMVLLQALNAKHGLLLRTNDPDRARQHLYKIKRENGDPALAELQISEVDFPDGNLRISKKGEGR